MVFCSCLAFRPYHSTVFKAICGHPTRPYDRHHYCFACRNQPKGSSKQKDVCQKAADGSPGMVWAYCEVCSSTSEEVRLLWKVRDDGSRPYKGWFFGLTKVS